MFFHVLKTWPLLAAASTFCLAADISKPACNAQNYGSMWPDTANHNPKMMTKLSQCGELQICSRRGRRYRWESLTVRVDQLWRGKKNLATPARCEALQVEEVADSHPPETN
jgi:hypothetical protein